MRSSCVLQRRTVAVKRKEMTFSLRELNVIFTIAMRKINLSFKSLQLIAMVLILPVMMFGRTMWVNPKNMKFN